MLQFMAGASDLSPFLSIQSLWALLSSVWVKQVGCKSDHLLPSDANVLPGFLCSTLNRLVILSLHDFKAIYSY